MSVRRYLIIVLPAIAVWLLVTGCYTKLYRPSVNGPPEAMASETLYDRYDSSAIDTTRAREDIWSETYPGGYDYYDRYDRYDRWNWWGRPRMRTRWGFDFYNYSPPYYWGYYGWEDYYGYPWWYSRYGDHRYWYPYSTGGTPGEPPSKRPFGRRGSGERESPPPTVTRPPSSTPSYVGSHGTPPPSRPAKSEGTKTKGQRSFGRRKR